MHHSAPERSIYLAALVAIPPDDPLHEIGDTARSILRRESDRYTSAAATAAVLSIGERTLRRCWAIMHYAKKSAIHGQSVIDGQVLGIIDKSAKDGIPATKKHGKPVIDGKVNPVTNPKKTAKTGKIR